MPSLGSLSLPLPNRRRCSDILVGMPPQLNNLRCHSGSNEGDAELFDFLRHMQTPVSSVGTNREKEGVWCFSANCNTVWVLVHGHRRERLARGYFDLGSSKRDLHSLTPPCDREPTRVVLRHPHNSRPLRHALLPERWFSLHSTMPILRFDIEQAHQLLQHVLEHVLVPPRSLAGPPTFMHLRWDSAATSNKLILK